MQPQVYTFSILLVALPTYAGANIASHLCYPPDNSIPTFMSNLERAAQGSNADAVASLSDQQQEMIITNANAFNSDFFNGHISKTSLWKKTADLFASMGLSETQKRGADLILSRVYQVDSTAVVLPVVLSYVAGHSISAADRKLLSRLGIDQPEAYLEIASDELRSHYQALTAAGAKYGEKGAWDFSEVDLSPTSLESNRKLEDAVSYFFSQSTAQALKDPERRHAVPIADFIVLPPRKQNITGKNLSPILTRNEYERQVQENLRAFEREVDQFKAAAEDVGTYGNLMRGRLGELIGVKRGHNGQSAPEIELKSYGDSINFKIDRLTKHLGVPAELAGHLLEASRQTTAYLSSQLEKGMEKLDSAKAAAISAPFIPVTLYLTPLVAGALGASGVGASAAATSVRAGQLVLKGKEVYGMAHATASSLAAIPMVFGGGLSGFNAAIETSYNGGSYLDRLQEELASNGASSLQASAMMSALPLLTASGSLALGASIKGVTAAGAYGWGTAASGVGFLGLGAKEGVVGGIDCFKEIQRVNQIALEVSEDAALNRASADLWKRCIAAGFDMADTVMAGGIISRSGINTLRSLHNRSDRPSMIHKQQTSKSEERSPMKPNRSGVDDDFFRQEWEILSREVFAKTPKGVAYLEQKSQWQAMLAGKPADYIASLEDAFISSFLKKGGGRIYDPGQEVVVQLVPEIGTVSAALLDDAKGMTRAIKYLLDRGVAHHDLPQQAAAILRARYETNYRQPYEVVRDKQKHILVEAGFAESDIQSLQQKGLIADETGFRERRAALLEELQVQSVKNKLGIAKEKAAKENAKSRRDARRESASSIENLNVAIWGSEQVGQVSALISRFILREGTIIADSLKSSDREVFQWFAPEEITPIMREHGRLKLQHQNDSHKIAEGMHRFLYDFLMEKSGTNERGLYPNRVDLSKTGGFVLRVPKPSD